MHGIRNAGCVDAGRRSRRDSPCRRNTPVAPSGCSLTISQAAVFAGPSTARRGRGGPIVHGGFEMPIRRQRVAPLRRRDHPDPLSVIYSRRHTAATGRRLVRHRRGMGASSAWGTTPGSPLASFAHVLRFTPMAPARSTLDRGPAAQPGARRGAPARRRRPQGVVATPPAPIKGLSMCTLSKDASARAGSRTPISGRTARPPVSWSLPWDRRPAVTPVNRDIPAQARSVALRPAARIRSAPRAQPPCADQWSGQS